MDCSQPTSPPWNYETSVSKIEAMIAKIESGELPLETAFSQFEEAIQEVKKCEKFLNQGTQRMNLLIETLEDEEEF